MKLLFRLGNLIPLLTILGAGAAVVLSLLQKMPLSLAEGIIIALLALLAADALTERLGVLRRIESALGNLTPSRHRLRSRKEIPRIDHFLQDASDILFVATAGTEILDANAHFLSEKIRSGCRFRVALLNPSGASLPVFEQQYGKPIVKYIENSLASLDRLSRSDRQGRCEVRLLDTLPPFLAIAKTSPPQPGSMIVALHAFKRNYDQRAYMVLDEADQAEWYSFYREQLEEIWGEGAPWEPSPEPEA